VNKAIRNSGSRDFWKLQHYLPNESMNHVKKFIATHYIMEGNGGVVTATRDELSDMVVTTGAGGAELEHSTAYNITGRFNSAVIIRHTGVDAVLFHKLNPSFDSQVALNGKYELRLPTLSMNLFVAKRYQILDESLALLMNTSR
jgi:membrane-bound lytic murein transglycosylase D